MYIDILKKMIDELQCDYGKKNRSYREFIQCVIDRVIALRDNQRTMYFIGNGGSAGIAIHMTADYLKNGRIRTHNMHDPATITCLGNDFGYEHIFKYQIELMAEPGDILVAISSSGNSPNIIRAIEAGRKKKCDIITFSGFLKNNSIRNLGDYNLYVPSMEYGIVESIHNLILQQIIDAIYFNDKNKSLLSEGKI